MKLSNMVIASFGDGRNLVGEGKMFIKDEARLRTEWVVLHVSEELCILSCCFFSTMSKNSVLEELRARRLVVIQEEI